MSRKRKTSKMPQKSKTKRLTIFNIRASSSGVRMAGASPILGKKVTVFPLSCPSFPDPLPICNSGKFRMASTTTTTTTAVATKMHRNDENKNINIFCFAFLSFFLSFFTSASFTVPIRKYSCEKFWPWFVDRKICCAKEAPVLSLYDSWPGRTNQWPQSFTPSCPGSQTTAIGFSVQRASLPASNMGWEEKIKFFREGRSMRDLGKSIIY